MKKGIKIILYVIGAVLALILIAVFALQTNMGKNFVRQKVVEYLNKKLNTVVQIDRLNYKIPTFLELNGVLFLDTQNDTMLQLNKLRVDIDMFALIQNKVEVNGILLEDASIHIYRTKPDTTFNFNYIIDAFVVKDDKQAVKEKENANKDPIYLDVSRLELKNVQFRMDDTTGGIFLYSHVDDLILKPSLLDFENMDLKAKELYVNGLKASMITDSSFLPPQVEDTAIVPLLLAIEKVNLNKVAFLMKNNIDSIYLKSDVEELNFALNNFNLAEQKILVNNLNAEDLNTLITMGKQAALATKDTTSTYENKWQILTNSIAINNANFQYNDNSQPALKNQVDYAHLDLKDIFLNVADAFYTPDSISADLKHLVAKEKSGFDLQGLRTKVVFTNTNLQLNDLYLLSSNSLLQDKIHLSYPSLETISKNLNLLKLELQLKNSKIGVNDALLFLDAEQRQQLLAYKNQSFKLEADLKGFLNALIIDQLYLSGLKGTVVDIKGKLNGLPNMDKMHYDLNLKDIRVAYADIAPFIPDSIKHQIQVPEWVKLSGKINGDQLTYHPDIHVLSADGDAFIKGVYSMKGGEGNEVYNLNISTDALDLGKILKQPDSVLSKVTLRAEIEGKGFDPQKMESRLNVQVLSLDAMKYTYHNISADGTIADKIALFNLRANDPNLILKMSGNAHFIDKFPTFYSETSIKRADLFSLHLMSDTFNVTGDIYTDFETINPDYPKGAISWVNGAINWGGIASPLEPVYFISEPQDSIQNLYLNASNILYARLSGQMPITQLGNAVLTHLDRHYKITDSIIPYNQTYDMALDGFITYNPLLNRWMPSLRPFDTLRFNSNLDRDTFNLNAYGSKLVYGDQVLDSIYINVKENRDTFSYQLGLKKYNMGDISLWSPSLRGLIRNDSIYALANVNDSLGERQFTLGGSMTQQHSSTDSGLIVARLFKGLRFNYEKWDVNPYNKFVWSKNGFYIDRLSISNGDQSININSESLKYNAPIQVSIRNFELSNITGMMSEDTLIAEGKLRAEGKIDLSDSFPKVDIAASIKELKAYSYDLGELDAKIENKTANTYYSFLQLFGKGNNIQLYGDYYMMPVNDNFDMTLNIQPLRLKSLEGLSFGAISNSEGQVEGQLKIKGNFDRPVINGTLNTKNLKTKVNMLNSTFFMPKEQIVFENQRMRLNQFKIYDFKNNEAKINGTIDFKDLNSYLLNLTFNADKWQPIHSQRADYNEFYGDLILSSNLLIKGSAMAPKVDGNLTIHDSTNFTYALIDEGPGIVESEGVVVFVDRRDTLSYLAIDSNKRNRLVFSEKAQMNVNVDVDPNAIFNVLIDPASGDMLQVKGRAQLNTFIAPDGTIGLTGVYDLSGGSYELNYNLLRKKFLIQKGSTITLSGDPLDADANITAVYNATMAPYDLVERQATAEQLVYYKQRLPFQVLLKIKGKVMEPEISFDIILPEEKENLVSSEVANTVQAKLAELRLSASDLNKQVFSVLLLGRFLSQDPFSSGNNANMEFVVKQSVSRFLNEQLNNLTSGLVEGLDLNVGLTTSEDYSTGQKANRTGIDISASKRFLDDRLKVTVGSNFELEGQAAQQQKENNFIPGNLSIDYQITKDGRYFIRAYRTNELRNLIDGYTTETGLGFRTTFEYNHLRELLRSRKNYRKNIKPLNKEEEEKESKNKESVLIQKNNSLIEEDDQG